MDCAKPVSVTESPKAAYSVDLCQEHRNMGQIRP